MSAKPKKRRSMRETVVLRLVSKLLIPFILLFALYVQFHGDFGPGGGFQAGVLFAAGLILFGLIHGLKALDRVVPNRLVEILMGLGVLLFGGVGVATMILHGNFLEYGVLNHHDPIHGQHLGILLIEIGVGLTVAMAMISIFKAFAGRSTS